MDEYYIRNGIQVNILAMYVCTRSICLCDEAESAANQIVGNCSDMNSWFLFIELKSQELNITARKNYPR